MRRMTFFHKLSYYLLPRRLRRKLKKWRCRSTRLRKTIIHAAIAIVVLVGVNNTGVYAQTIENNRVDHGNWSYTNWDTTSYVRSAIWTGCDWNDSGSEVTTGSNYWFGKGTQDIQSNILDILNTNGTTLGTTVRVTNLDTDHSNIPNSAMVYTREDNGSGGYNYIEAGTESHPPSGSTHTADPRYETYAYIYNGTRVNGSNDVNVNSGNTTYFNVAIDPVTTTGYGSGHYTIGTMVKQGAGTLSLEVENLEITNFTGAEGGGTLLLANDSNGDTVLDKGTLGSTTVTLNGAGNGSNVPSFTFASENKEDNTTAGNENLWTITGSLDGNGYVNIGQMNVTGTATMDARTDIGTLDAAENPANSGYQDMVTVTFGADDADDIINIYKGRLATSQTFIGGAAGISGDSTLNHLWQATFNTGTDYGTGTSTSDLKANVGASLGNYGTLGTSDAHIIHNIGNGSIWNNGSRLIVGNTSQATVNIFNAGIVNTYITEMGIADDPDAIGVINVSGAGSQWNNTSYATVGENGEGQVNIWDKGYGKASGLYIGKGSTSDGYVSVENEGSLLEIYQSINGDVTWNENDIEGSGNLNVSDRARVNMYDNSEILLSGNAFFSNDALLHMEANSRIVSMEHGGANNYGGKIFFSNARLEGVGLLSAVDGVFFTQDSGHGLPGSQASIDPGLFYGWKDKREVIDRYGTLTFENISGDPNAIGLLLTGNVVTSFDVNAGDILDPNRTFTHGDHDQDMLVVTNGSAALAGTLDLHARATDYYDQGVDLMYEIVQTQNGGAGTIDSLYDAVNVLPSRFFRDVTQVIDESSLGGGDQSLYISMYRNENPFEQTGQTYNQKQTGMGLDGVYNLDLKEWFPVLRSFWYMGDAETRDILSFWSGEVRAHSLLLPVQSPWRYANNRAGFNRENGHVFFGPQNRGYYEPWIDPCRPADCLDSLQGGPSSKSGLWGTAIYDYADVDSDGNASGYRYSRIGFVVGLDRAYNSGKSYIGVMFGYDQGDLDMTGAGAKSDDFFLGLYHGKRIGNGWEWKNYLGMGIQDYDVNRSMGLWLGIPDGAGSWNDEYHHINANAGFHGYTFAASTELARPFYFGDKHRWTIRPYAAIDLNAVWQDEATESGNDPYSNLVVLKYHSASDVRTVMRTGVDLERGARWGNLRTGVYGSYLLGGRRYTNVDNQFAIGQPYGVGEFNVRGVDDGAARINWHAGANFYLSRDKLHMAFLDYLASTGSRSTVHSVQLGYQRTF